ncbi:MAG TPA: hypothetical protein VMU25_00030 [Candidatus Paceibacterota bacterium]|nr:hypothetical protein [Candidatus Paceibacterota bacterium]
MTTNLIQTVKLLSTPYPKTRDNDEVHDSVLRRVLHQGIDFVRHNSTDELLELVESNEMSCQYWVAAFEAFIVGNFQQADDILSWIVRKLLPEAGDRHPVPPAIIVGILRAAVWCETFSEAPNHHFAKILPGHLGNLLRAQAEFHQENDPAEKWIIGQFSEMLSMYLNYEHGKYFDRVSAILKPLQNVCLRNGVQNKLLHELVTRLFHNMTQTARINMMWNWHKRTHDMDESELQFVQ